MATAIGLWLGASAGSAATVGTIAIVGASGAAVAGYGQYQQGKAAEQQSKSEAAWHQYNAEISRRDAEAERESTRAEATQQARAAKIERARARTLIGASGVNIEGSPLLVLEDNAEQRKLQEADILLSGRRRASSFESQSILDVSKGKAAKVAGGAAKRAGVTRAGGTILQGAAAFGASRAPGARDAALARKHGI